MERELRIKGVAKAIILMMVWPVVLFMVFCDSETASILSLIMVKAVGFSAAWVLLKWMKIY